MKLNSLGETVIVFPGSAMILSSFGFADQNVPVIDVRSWVIDKKDEKIEQLEARIQELEEKGTKSNGSKLLRRGRLRNTDQRKNR